MKSTKILILAAAAGGLLLGGHAGFAQLTPAFTYQGRLVVGDNSSTNGIYDFQFQVFDTPTTGTGNSFGSPNPNTVLNVPVTNGLFTVTLNFGSSPFAGSDRWLEISVRTNGGGAYVTLSPRQALSPTPYAIYSANAAQLGGQAPSAYVLKAGDTMTGALNLPASGLAVGGNQLVAAGSGKVGIGTVAPASKLSVAGSADFAGYVGINRTTPVSAGSSFFDVGTSASTYGGMYIDTAANGWPFYGYSQAGVAQAWTFVDGADGNKWKLWNSGIHLTVMPSGNVGIGTASPSSLLQVNGTVTAIGFSGSGANLTAVVNSLNGLNGAVTLSAGPNITLTPNGNNIQIGAAGGGNWSLTGNAGTTPGVNFLGTTDNQALELKANGARALRLEPNANGPNVIGGNLDNWVAGAYGATIGGGLTQMVAGNYGAIGGGATNAILLGATGAVITGGMGNIVQTNATFGVIGGGTANLIQLGVNRATIGGGISNVISGYNGFIGGGEGNVINGNGYRSVIAGGWINTANGVYATVAGGANNHANNLRATIAGGGDSSATGNTATIAGGEANVAGGDFTAIGGGQQNNAGAQYATIGGGSGNSAAGLVCTVAGGEVNQATGPVSTIAGGDGNSTQGEFDSVGGGAFNVTAGGIAGLLCGELPCPWGPATIAGGMGNVATAPFATVSGGMSNSVAPDVNLGVTGYGGTVGGGTLNFAPGSYSVVPGGSSCRAGGDFSFAAGRGAKADHLGAFVWADDSTTTAFVSTGANQFDIRCAGGAEFTSGVGGANQTVAWAPGSGSWSFTSDRNTKDRIEPVDAPAVLEKVARLPLAEWSYKGYDQRHIGPMAQDFHDLFPLNDSDKTLNEVDLHGVALAAIQGLNQKVSEKDARIQEQASVLRQQAVDIAELKARLDTLEQLLNPKAPGAK